MDVLQLKENKVTLPSLGLFYPEVIRSQLINGTDVKIRPLVAGDHRNLSGLIKENYLFIKALLEKVIVEPKLDPHVFLLEDMLAILFGMRILSYGPSLLVDFACSNCEKFAEAEVLLTEVNVQNAGEVEGLQARDIEYNLNGKKAIIHLPTMQDEKAIYNQLNGMKQRGAVNDEAVDKLYVRLAQSLDKVEGYEVLTLTKKLEIIDGLPMDALEDLSEFLHKKRFGIIQTAIVPCRACGTDNELRLSMTPEFFRPTRRA